MKTVIKIIICVILIITQICLYKMGYNRGQQDGKRVKELINLEVNKIS